MSGVRVLMAKAGGDQVTLRRSVNEGQLDVARPFRSDNEHDALGGLVPERKRLSRVLARQPVDHIQVWISAPLDYPAADLGFLVRVIYRNDGQPNPRIAARVLGLERTLACADQNRIPFEVHPYGIDLRPSIAHQGRRCAKLAPRISALISSESWVACFSDSLSAILPPHLNSVGQVSPASCSRSDDQTRLLRWVSIR